MYGLITPIPSHHIINREDGGKKKSWVLQRDGKPAAFQQPVTDTTWIQRHLARSIVTRIKLAQIINQSFSRQSLHRRRYVGKAGWERTGKYVQKDWKEAESAAASLSVFAARLVCSTGCWTVGNVAARPCQQQVIRWETCLILSQNFKETTGSWSPPERSPTSQSRWGIFWYLSEKHLLWACQCLWIPASLKLCV